MAVHQLASVPASAEQRLVYRPCEAPLTEVRSTLIQSSLLALRARDLGERYKRQLEPRYHEIVLNTLCPLLARDPARARARPCDMNAAMRRWWLCLVCLFGCKSFSMSEEMRQNLATPASEEAAAEPALPPDAGPDDLARASWAPPDYASVDDDSLSWQQANLTTYTSYPAEGSEECIKYNGCFWRGKFTAFGDHVKKSPAWVAAHNIASVRFDHFNERAFRTLRVRSGRHSIDVVVYDSCADSDCSGCCTRNSAETGFLIDLEVHTADRFGVFDGTVEWACIDCDRDPSQFPKPGKLHSDADRPRARQSGPRRGGPPRQ